MAWRNPRCGDRFQSLYAQAAALANVTEPVGLAATLTGDAR